MEVEVQVSTDVFAFANYAYGVHFYRDTHERNLAGPRRRASGGVRLSVDAGPGAMLWVTYFDDLEFQNLYGASVGEVEEYALLNGRISYPFRLSPADAKLFLQGFNLLDHDHRENPGGDS